MREHKLSLKFYLEEKMEITIKTIRKGSTGYKRILSKSKILKGTNLYGKRKVSNRNDKR